MSGYNYNELLQNGERKLEAGCIRLLGYVPYFYLMTRLIAPEGRVFLTAIVVSLTFSLECCLVSHALTLWHRQSSLRHTPLFNITFASTICLAMPLLGLATFRIMSPAGIDLVHSLQFFGVFLLPCLGFLVIQALTRRCPVVTKRLHAVSDHPHFATRRSGTSQYHR